MGPNIAQNIGFHSLPARSSALFKPPKMPNYPQPNYMNPQSKPRKWIRFVKNRLRPPNRGPSSPQPLTPIPNPRIPRMMEVAYD